MPRCCLTLLLLALCTGCSEQARQSVPLMGNHLVDQEAIAKRQRIHQDLHELATLTAINGAQAFDKERANSTDSAMRAFLLGRKIRNATTAWDLAFEQNPEVGILKLTAINAVSSRYLSHRAEAHRAPSIAARQQLATASWQVADRHLSEDVRAELRILVETWPIDDNSDDEFGVRLRQLGDQLVAGSNGRDSKSNLLAVISLDPFAGLDPAAKAIEASRRTAERALYLADKLPLLVSWQLEALCEDLARSPTGVQMRGDATSIAHTLATLPDRMSAERQALVADLSSQEAKLATLAGEVRAALDSGNATLQSAERLLIAFNVVAARFDKPDQPDASPSRPFDITEYERTATAIGIAAHRLDGVLGTAGTVAGSNALDLRITQLEQAGDRLVRNAALALAGLIVLAGAAVIAVRRFSR